MINPELTDKQCSVHKPHSIQETEDSYKWIFYPLI